MSALHNSEKEEDEEEGKFKKIEEEEEDEIRQFAENWSGARGKEEEEEGKKNGY